MTKYGIKVIAGQKGGGGGSVCPYGSETLV